MKQDLICIKDDEWYTPKNAIYPIINYLKPNSTVLCPFDLEISNFVKIFKENGFNVIHSHISENKNFFEIEDFSNIDYIISNPPYSDKNRLLETFFRIKKPFALLISLSGLFESDYRFRLFKENEFEIMFFDKRIRFIKDYNKPDILSSPPYPSVYLCHNILPKKYIFERVRTWR